MVTFKSYRLGREKMLVFLREMANELGPTSVSGYFPPSPPVDFFEKFIHETNGNNTVPEEIIRQAVRSKTGGVVLFRDGGGLLILPPFPVHEEKVSIPASLEPLLSCLGRDHLIVIVLVRLGAYGIGICRGETLLSSKVGTGLVHGRHRQGGSSAPRFERHREKQIESFLTRVCHHVREQIEPVARMMDFIVYGGARQTIIELKKKCCQLRELTIPELPALLDIPDPRQKVLEEAIHRVWSSKITAWQED